MSRVNLPRDLPIEELHERFVARHWLAFDDVLPTSAAAAIADALLKRNLECRAARPDALSAGAPSYMFFEERIHAHRACRKPCAPICAVAASMTDGALLEFVQGIAGESRLQPGSIDLRMYGKGSHVDRSLVTFRGVEAMCCLTSGRDTAHGGLLRFGDGERVCPRFGTLYVAERVPGQAGPVTLVEDHGPLITLSVWFE